MKNGNDLPYGENDEKIQKNMQLATKRKNREDIKRESSNAELSAREKEKLIKDLRKKKKKKKYKELQLSPPSSHFITQATS